MHTSQAKALLKGCYRTGEFVISNALNKYPDLDKLNPKHKFQALLNLQLEALKDFSVYLAISYDRNRKYRIFENLYMSAVPSDIKGIGALTPFMYSFADEKKYIRNKPKNCGTFISRLLLHEHFIQRLIQRLNLASIVEVGRHIAPLLNWLVTASVSTRGMNNCIHILFSEHVFIVKKIKADRCLVLQTVLQREFFNPDQSAFYQRGYEKLGKFNFVVIDEAGTPLYQVPVKDSFRLSPELVSKSKWFKEVIKKDVE